MTPKAKSIDTMQQMYPLPRRFAETGQKGEAPGLFYFHEPGDYLLGFLLCKEKVETLHYPFTTYKLRAIEARQDGVTVLLAEDQVIEFPANIRARRIIDDNELIGSLVRIVFTGKQGRQKAYNVFRDKGTFTKDLRRQTARKKKKRKPKGK